MILTVPFVITLNGKITKGDDAVVSKWSSAEDQAHFKELQNKHQVIIRSSTTYKIAKNYINKNSNQRHIVLTRDPSKHESEKIENVVEFTNESPKELVERLQEEGVDKVLLSAGGRVFSSFLKDKVVDKFLLTIEPKIFGKGVDLIAEGDFEVDFELESVERLNDKGTLLLTLKPIY